MPQRPPSCFDPGWYLQTNPDVAQAGLDPAVHFRRFGRFEGRMPCNLIAAQAEKDLWAGQTSAAVLTALRQDTQGPDRGWASYALARWQAAHGDWGQADQLLTVPDVVDSLYDIGLLPPVLLLIEAALRGTAPDGLARAAQLSIRARQQFGPCPDLLLIAANLQIRTTPFSATTWEQTVRPLYAAQGLAAPMLDKANPDAVRFDQLTTGAAPLWHRGWATGWRGRPTRSARALVSVIMPARNAAATLDTALRSLCAQSWPQLEILVVDNGSTDDTRARAQAWAVRDARIQVLDGSAEPGAYAARNIGLAAARGDFITVQDADDWVHPDKIALQLRPLLRSATGRPKLQANVLQTSALQASVSHWVRALPDLHFTNWRADVGLIHRNVSSLMIRRAVHDRLGFWDRARVGADSEFYHRLSRVYGPMAIAQVCPGLPLSFGRHSAQSLTQDRDIGLLGQFGGARHRYAMASRDWHDTLSQTHPAYLPQYPATRPFAVDQTLELPPAVAPPGPHRPQDQP